MLPCSPAPHVLHPRPRTGLCSSCSPTFCSGSFTLLCQEDVPQCLQELQHILCSLCYQQHIFMQFFPLFFAISAHAVLLITSTSKACWHGYLWVLSPNNACNVIELERKQSLIHFKLKQCPTVVQQIQTWSGHTVLHACQGAQGVHKESCRTPSTHQPSGWRLVCAGPPCPKPKRTALL